MHVALLCGSALLWPVAAALQARVAPAPLRSPLAGSGAFYVQVELDQAWWPLPSAIQACYDRSTIQASGWDYFTTGTEAYGYAAAQPATIRTWGADHAQRFPDEAVADVESCMNMAHAAGWSGQGRVLVRVDRPRIGPPTSRAVALDDTARDPRLLCCLREAQETCCSRACVLAHRSATPSAPTGARC